MIPFCEKEDVSIDVVPMEFRALTTNGVVQAEVCIQQPEPVQQDTLQEQIEEARMAALIEARAEMEAAISKERKRVVLALQKFQQDRERYFKDIEQEVVGLALAIAERVLHRETSIEPLLLKGSVHAALEKLAEECNATLRVPESEYREWMQEFEGDAHAHVKPDATLPPGECVLQTQMGRVDFGVRAQLKEIEQGFLDLLGHKPVAA